MSNSPSHVQISSASSALVKQARPRWRLFPRCQDSFRQTTINRDKNRCSQQNTFTWRDLYSFHFSKHLCRDWNILYNQMIYCFINYTLLNPSRGLQICSDESSTSKNTLLTLCFPHRNSTMIVMCLFSFSFMPETAGVEYCIYSWNLRPRTSMEYPVLLIFLGFNREVGA